ncbi:MAG: SRPBCC family protein [Pseudomonadota bacterium]|nr:SRPBCC family protein [Pseudomonadota bacterium]
MQSPSADLPSSMRGSKPADLHVYRRGRPLSRDASPERTGNLRASLRDIDEQRLARALGWFSVALGAVEVMAPHQLGRAIGMKGNASLLRAMGLREIASGVGILTRQKRGWMWSRVAGDAMDLAVLGAAMRSDRSNRTRVAVATAAVAGVTALDMYCSQQMSRNAVGSATRDATNSHEPVREVVIVNATPEACYGMWHDFPNFPRFMHHVESVRETGQGQYHWVVKAPGGGTVEWDSRVTTDEPNRRIAWETLPGAEVENRGSVEFEAAPGARGTIVRVEMSYLRPGGAIGAIGAIAAKVTGNSPAQQVRQDLRRFKQTIETGEIPSTGGQPSGRRGAVYNFMRKASRR